MKRFYAVLGMALLLAACAPSQTPEESDESPPPHQAQQESVVEGGMSAEEEAISQLNAMCPENWCLGDYRYEFAQIACLEASCTLTFLAERDGRSYDGTVEIDYDEPLIDDFGDLEPSYFERVTDALDEWESSQTEAG